MNMKTIMDAKWCHDYILKFRAHFAFVFFWSDVGGRIKKHGGRDVDIVVGTLAGDFVQVEIPFFEGRSGRFSRCLRTSPSQIYRVPDARADNNILTFRSVGLIIRENIVP